MKKIGSRSTKPEIAVRKVLRKLKISYRSNVDSVVGKPDLVLTQKRIAIFVHGCFWHYHSCKKGRASPKVNRTFWSRKRNRTVLRDRYVHRTLRRSGWRVLVMWECGLKDYHKTESRLKNFISRT